RSGWPCSNFGKFDNSAELAQCGVFAAKGRHARINKGTIEDIIGVSLAPLAGELFLSVETATL
ncbi:MAG: hypothetical protein WCD52_14970, partial [Xanthobacteraceae bacterium]